MNFTARVGNPQRMEAGGACRPGLARSVECREYAARLLDRPLRCRRSLATSAGKQAGRSHALPAGYRHDRRPSRSERQPARTAGRTADGDRGRPRAVRQAEHPIRALPRTATPDRHPSPARVTAI